MSGQIVLLGLPYQNYSLEFVIWIWNIGLVLRQCVTLLSSTLIIYYSVFHIKWSHKDHSAEVKKEA